MNVALIDYGAGNLTSVIKGLETVGATVNLVSNPAAIEQAPAIVIPGVGHFSATASLGRAPWLAAIKGAIARGVPLLGICLGLQWLFDGSAESPETAGLGLIPGRCFRLEGDVKVPHVGWNTLERTARPSRLLADVPDGASAYFTHSYAAPTVDATVATTTHAMSFSAAVERDLVFGVQFHPEKSGTTGLTMLANFMRVAAEAR
ncbi:MAG: imidazole glycerol phosphate synthase subunit HisH [Vicinamibacterales bacterium]